ncbi:hypothetical protein mRhiFer1_010026 [Rhinolophus ferrumequinum]|uniref:Uncharacterized protein n=1 Tax=Rhinolophus ferrumequinum TaxID=59479 RepID=A0A7J7Y574_RHIFE|nr:hypothetical protein mRhiFer1_010026 [Rhinolophus ferrumequinum]
MSAGGSPPWRPPAAFPPARPQAPTYQVKQLNASEITVEKMQMRWMKILTRAGNRPQVDGRPQVADRWPLGVRNKGAQTHAPDSPELRPGCILKRMALEEKPKDASSSLWSSGEQQPRRCPEADVAWWRMGTAGRREAWFPLKEGTANALW